MFPLPAPFVDVSTTRPFLRSLDDSHSRVHRFQIINDLLLTFEYIRIIPFLLAWAYYLHVSIIPLNVSRYVRHNTNLSSLPKYYKGDNCLSTLSKFCLLIITLYYYRANFTPWQLLLKGIPDVDSSLLFPFIS